MVMVSGSGVEMVDQIVSTGYAKVRFQPAAAERLADLHAAANEFFRAGPGHNARYSNDELTNGYRPPEAAYAAAPDMPDVNDSFLYWNSSLGGRIPYSHEITPFLDVLETYRIVA